MNSGAQFSRSAGMGAKCDDDVRVRIPSEVKDDLQREARRCGMTDAEFVRDLICLRLYGMDGMRKMHEQRLAQVGGALFGMSHERGTE